MADRIVFLDDVADAEKPFLVAGSVAYVLPSKPRPEFVETFGIALVEKMLAGGGPLITTDTGGIGEGRRERLGPWLPLPKTRRRCVLRSRSPVERCWPGSTRCRGCWCRSAPSS